MAGRNALDDVARVHHVVAETYRAYEIESYDTAFLIATLDEQVQLKLAVSHTLREGSAGESQSDLERYDFEQATLEFPTWRTANIVWKDGKKSQEHLESAWRDYRDVVRENFLSYARYLRGETARPTTTLQDSEPFVRLCHESQHSTTGIKSFSSDRIHQNAQGGCSVRGLEEELRQFALT
jgi:hypothetical protein